MEQSINTSRIGKRVLKSCVSWVNFFTVFFILFMQIVISFNQDFQHHLFLTFLVGHLFYFYVGFVGIMMAKPLFRIVEGEGNGLGIGNGIQSGSGRVIRCEQVDEIRQVKIGESLINFSIMLWSHLRYFLTLLAINTFLSSTCQHLSETLYSQLVQNIEHIVSLLSKTQQPLANMRIEQYLQRLFSQELELIPEYIKQESVTCSVLLLALQIFGAGAAWALFWFSMTLIYECIQSKQRNLKTKQIRHAPAPAPTDTDTDADLSLGRVWRIWWSRFLNFNFWWAECRFFFRFVILFIFEESFYCFYLFGLCFLFWDVMQHHIKNEAIAHYITDSIIKELAANNIQQSHEHNKIKSRQLNPNNHQSPNNLVIPIINQNHHNHHNHHLSQSFPNPTITTTPSYKIQSPTRKKNGRKTQRSRKRLADPEHLTKPTKNKQDKQGNNQEIREKSTAKYQKKRQADRIYQCYLQLQGRNQKRAHGVKRVIYRSLGESTVEF